MIARFEKFSSTISEVDRYWHKLAGDVMEKHGLKGPQAIYFTTMYKHPDGITAVKLAELSARDKSDVSRAVAQFEKQGFVERVAVNKNYYRGLLKLTEAGRKIAECINDKAKTAVEICGKGLSEADRNTFYEALDLICSNLRSLAKEGL